MIRYTDAGRNNVSSSTTFPDVKSNVVPAIGIYNMEVATCPTSGHVVSEGSMTMARVFVKIKKYYIVFLLLLFGGVVILSRFPTVQNYQHYYNYITKPAVRTTVENYTDGKWRMLSDEQLKSLSKLGRILFLDEEVPKISDTEKKYQILVWKYGNTIDNRHIKHFTNQRFDPFENCSVSNCEISYRSDDLHTADIVIIHLHRTTGVKDLPQGPRNPKQIWAFLTDESPQHTFLYSERNYMRNYNDLFNWSMSYRMDSDIPVPYGRTVALKEPQDAEIYPERWNKRFDVLVAILGSNCGGNNNRWGYVRELQKHIAVDVYGGCGPLSCPGHFNTDCEAISRYIFYLAFENSNCDEYITEKLWWNAYSKNSIPIIMGGSKNSNKQLLPPSSYISVDDFASPNDLADYLIYLNRTGLFYNFFQWKNYFHVLNEHGYFKSASYHYCRVCEAMNYNSKEPQVYDDLERYWVTDVCYESWDSMR